MKRIGATDDAERSIPLIETVHIRDIPVGIQYNTRCQMSMISRSVLQQLPENMYSVGNSVNLRVLTYTGEGQTISTTSIRLKLNGFWLKLLAIEADLNNGSAYSFPTQRNGEPAQEIPPHPTSVKYPSCWAATTL